MTEQIDAGARRKLVASASFIGFSADEIEQSLVARFERTAAHYAERLAVKDTTRALTYEALNALANRLADALLAQLGADNEPIGLLMRQGVLAAASIFGLLKARKIFVPLDPTLPPARLMFMLANSQARLLVTDSQHLELAHKLAQSGRQVLDVATLSPDLATTNPNVPLSPDMLACILHTSGSTGQPKGVIHSHRTMLHHIANYTNLAKLSADDRLTQLSSNNAVTALRDEFGALLNGAALYPFSVREEGPARLVELLRQEEITICNIVPTVLRQLADTLSGDERFPKLRLLKVGGEPVYRKDVELFRRHFSADAVLYVTLGTTESGTIGSFFVDHDTSFEGDSVPAGYPGADMEALVLDEAGQPLGANQVGEITARSRYLSLGYWRRPDLTEKAFKANPAGSEVRIYRTGDLGYQLPDGCLIHLGRKDFQVKVSGNRVELGEIERALLDLPAVKEAVLVAQKISSEDQRLIAYVVIREHCTLSVNVLRRALAEKLPSYMIPSAFVLLDKLPHTSNNKVDRQALPAPSRARPELEAPFVAPRNAMEETLADIWADVLEIDAVGVDDVFLDLGGNSLLAMRAFAQIEKKFGKKLPLALLYQSPTVAHLARVLQDSVLSWSSLVPIQPHGSKPPFFGVHGRDGNVLFWYNLVEHLPADQPFYGLQAQGLDGVRPALTRIEDMASLYLEEIKRVQPYGPYYLGGFSMGGEVAFEMAQQLVALGETVALLVMFDTYNPARAVRPPVSAPRNEFLTAHAQPTVFERMGVWQRKLSGHLQRLSALSLREQARYLWRDLSMRVRRAHLFQSVRRYQRRGEPLPIALLVPYIRECHTKAVQNYAPQVYAGHITLFRARESLALHPPDARMGWGPLATGGLSVHIFDSTHRMIDPEFASELAKQLVECLERAQSRQVLNEETDAERPTDLSELPAPSIEK